MAKNNNLFNFTPDFISQLIFGSFLTFILIVTGSPASLSIFLGILGGFILGWITSASKTSPEAPTLASSDGIDVGLKYWLFFLLGFVWLGYSAPLSILLGGIGAIGGGWIIAWWGSKEETRTQLPVENIEEGDERLSLKSTRQQKRRVARRFRRPRGINFRFWQR